MESHNALTSQTPVSARLYSTNQSPGLPAFHHIKIIVHVFCFPPPFLSSVMLSRLVEHQSLVLNSCVAPLPWRQRDNGNRAHIFVSGTMHTVQKTNAHLLLFPWCPDRGVEQRGLRLGQLPAAESGVRMLWPATKSCCKNKPPMAPLGNEYSTFSYYHDF